MVGKAKAKTLAKESIVNLPRPLAKRKQQSEIPTPQVKNEGISNDAEVPADDECPGDDDRRRSKKMQKKISKQKAKPSSIKAKAKGKSKAMSKSKGIIPLLSWLA